MTVLAVAAAATLGTLFFGATSAAAASMATDARDLDWLLVSMGVMLSVAAIWNRGLMNQAAHRSAGLDTSPGEMTRVAAVAFSAQKFLKSGGASGLAVFVHHGRRRERAAPQVTAACVLVAASAFVALGVAMAATISVLALSGRLTGWWLLAAVGFTAYGAAIVALATLARRHRSALDRLWMFAHSVVGRVRRRPYIAPDPLPIDDVFAALAAIRRSPFGIRRTLAHAIVGKASGALMLLVAARCAGLPLSPTDALVAYAIVLSTSLVAFVPGGFGIVEASTAALLISGGASTSAAAFAITLFRIFDLWIPFGVGVFAARGQFRRREQLIEAVSLEAPERTEIVEVLAAAA